ncbi:MAG: YchJ family protein [Candidatus Berkiellales bacterium]
MKTEDLCPCGSETPYDACCGKYIEQHQYPELPEQLMRSRYTAFVKGQLDYLVATMRDPAAKKFDVEEVRSWLKDIQWQGLKVIDQRLKSPTLGFVSFEARYLMNGIPEIITEKSEFHKKHSNQECRDQWFYVDGKPLNPQRSLKDKTINRNALCLCQSGKKYKHCCGK